MDITNKLLWNVSLSTMWAIKNSLTLEDSLIAARQMGFSQIELNHQIDTAMLLGIELSRFSFSSIHEPCPADISTEQLKARDWLVSSLDEACRQEGVKSVRRSIDLAKQIGAPAVVVHAGSVPAEPSLEPRLWSLFKTGQRRSDVFDALQKKILQHRSERAGLHLSSVKRSLIELLEYADKAGISLGLENRYHFMDIPSPDETGALLELVGPTQGNFTHLGFVYDTGHAQALSRLGFYPQEEWLDRFATHIIGVHLHDAKGITDHRAPGTGEVDFDHLAGFLPEHVFRTVEVRPDLTTDQLTASLTFLADHGCIQPAEI